MNKFKLSLFALIAATFVGCGGGGGGGIDKNYFHRVAKKLNLLFIFTDEDGERPGRVMADGTGTGYFMDPFNSSKR